MLFLGPTGVGKTETAELLTERLFGSREKLVRLDMSEYMTVDSIDLLRGANMTEDGIHGRRQSRELASIRGCHNLSDVVLIDQGSGWS